MGVVSHRLPQCPCRRTFADAELDGIVDELMEGAERIGRELRAGKPSTYPPGVDPERMREIQRAALRESIKDARAQR